MFDRIFENLVDYWLLFGVDTRGHQLSPLEQIRRWFLCWESPFGATMLFDIPANPSKWSFTRLV